MKDNVFVVCMSAFMLAGEMVVPGEVAELTDSEARDLLGRGKVRVATADDGVPDAEAEAYAAENAVLYAAYAAERAPSVLEVPADEADADAKAAD